MRGKGRTVRSVYEQNHGRSVLLDERGDPSVGTRGGEEIENHAGYTLEGGSLLPGKRKNTPRFRKKKDETFLTVPRSAKEMRGKKEKNVKKAG